MSEELHVRQLIEELRKVIKRIRRRDVREAVEALIALLR